MSENDFNIKYNTQQVLYNQQQPTLIINNNVGDPYNQAASTIQPQNNTSNPSENKRAISGSTEQKKDPFELAGNKKYEDYDFDGAIEQYLKSLNVKSNNPTVHFKLSCLYSILEQEDSAFFHLGKAVEKGFYNLTEIENHDHLSFLRSQPEFPMFKKNGYKQVSKLQQPEDSGLDISDSIITQIERLAKLRDSGVIDEDDFLQQKQKLFNQ